MDSFELVFGFFGVLIAFAFAELLTGFVFTIRERLINRSSALAVALAALVLVDLVTFWTQLWGLRAYVPPALGALLLATLSCSLLFIAAKLVLPQERSGTSLEDHFQRVRGTVVLAVIAANIPPLALFVAKVPAAAVEFRLLENTIWGVLLLIVGFSRRRLLLWVAVAFLTLMYVWAAVLSLQNPEAFDISAPSSV